MIRDLGAQLRRGRLPGLDAERALVQPVQHVLPREADSAVRLDRTLADEDGCVGGVGLRGGGGDRRLRIVDGDAPRCPPGERPGELEVGVRARERMRDGLVRADAATELLSLGDVRDPQLERTRVVASPSGVVHVSYRR